MNLIVEPIIKNKTIANNVSAYQPTKAWRPRLAQLRSEMEVGDEIRNKVYREFNNRTILGAQDDYQKTFNNNMPEVSSDPSESWKSNTIRPVSRNKVISIVAHITSGILVPVIEAQNKNSISDKEAALIMKDLLDFVLDQSGYARKFVFGMIAAAVNPAVIFEVGYAEVMRKFKEILENGKWKEKEMLDEVFSGFLMNIVPVEELFIGDIYEGEIQKQPFLFRRRVIDFSNAKIKYGHLKQFKYVKPGIRNFSDPGVSTYYEHEDERLGDRKVEEVIYYNRLADLEIPLVNGIPMTEDPDRPLQRKDKLYPFAKGGYELIDEGRFFYYKSLVDKMAPDQSVIDTLYNMVIDGTFLQLYPPMANYGGEEVTSNVIIPGMITNFQSDKASLQSLLPQQNLQAGLNVMQKVEASLSESSQDPLQAGQGTKGSQTAFEVARLEENAKKVLGLFGKMVSFIVEDIGKLMVGDILQYMTYADVQKLVGDGMQLKYQSVLVPDRIVDGKKTDRRIDFEMMDEDELIDERFNVPGLEDNQKRTLQRSVKIKQEENKLGIKIAKVDPTIFRELKFKVRGSTDFMKTNSEAVLKALNLEAYDRAIQNPISNKEAVTRDFLFAVYKPGEEEKYMAEQPQQMPEMAGQPGQEKIQQILGVGQPSMGMQV